MSLIASVPVAPKAPTDHKAYLFTDWQLVDRVGGRSDGTVTGSPGCWSFLLGSADGAPDTAYGPSDPQLYAGPAFECPLSAPCWSDCGLSSASSAGPQGDAAGAAYAYVSAAAQDWWSLQTRFSADGTLAAAYVSAQVAASWAGDGARFGYGVSGADLAAAYVAVAGLTSATFGGPRVYVGSTTGAPLDPMYVSICPWRLPAGSPNAPTSPTVAAAGVEYMLPYAYTRTANNSRPAGAGTAQGKVVETASLYTLQADPLAGAIVYLSHCTGAVDDHKIVDVINGLPATFSGDAYIDGSVSVYDDVSLRFEAHAQAVASATYDGFYSGLLNNDFTVSAAVKLDAVPPGYCPLLCSGGASVDFVLGFNGSRELALWSSSTAGTWDINGLPTGVVVPASWCVVTMVRNLGALYMFLNGTLVSTLPVGALGGGSAPASFNALSTNANVKFDNLYVSKAAEHLESHAVAPWSGTGAEAYSTFDGATLDSSTTVKASLSGGTLSAVDPYAGAGCLKFTSGGPKVALEGPSLDALFEGPYSVELTFYVEGTSGDYAPILVNTSDDGYTDFAIGFSTDKALRLWASGPGSTTYNVFNGLSTGLTVAYNAWNYLRLSGADGWHRVSLNGAHSADLSAAALTGGRPASPFTSDATMNVGEIRISTAERQDDLMVLRRPFTDNGTVETFDVIYFDPKVTLFPPVALSVSGENVSQAVAYP